MSIQELSTGNPLAQGFIKKYQTERYSTAKRSAVVAAIALLIVAGMVVGGKFIYIEFIGDIKLSLGVFAMLPTGGFCMHSTFCVANYIQGKRAKEQFNKPLADMDGAFKNALLKDLDAKKQNGEELAPIELVERSLNDSGSIKKEVKHKKLLTAVKVSALILSVILALGCTAFAIHSMGLVHALSASSFTLYDALNVLAFNGIFLSLGLGALSYVYIQTRLKPHDPHLFLNIV